MDDRDVDCPLRSKSSTGDDPFLIRFVATICLGTLGHYRRCDQEQVLRKTVRIKTSLAYWSACWHNFCLVFMFSLEICLNAPRSLSRGAPTHLSIIFVPLFSITLLSLGLGALLDNVPGILNNHFFPCAYVWSTQIIFPLYVMRNYSVLFVPEILVIPHGYGIHKFALKNENM